MLVCCLGVAACSGEAPEASPVQVTPTSPKTSAPAPSPEQPEPSSPEPREAKTRAQRWPFTGEQVRGRFPRRRGIVAKIDNSSSAQPQVGLEAADLVVEQLVEGGTTRLAAFFHSRLPRRAGPVRSMRASDIGIVAPTGALLVAAGGAPPTRRRVRRAGIDTVGEGAAGFFRHTGRSAPYNLMVNLVRLSKARRRGDTPAAYLPWGRTDGLPDGRHATSLSARFSGAHTTSWTYRRGTWRRNPDYAAARDDILVDSVLVLRVRLTDAGYRDPAGNPVPETVLTGTGQATLFHAGRSYDAMWSKRSVRAPMRLRSRRGAQLSVPAGRTWIELVPTSRNGGALTVGG